MKNISIIQNLKIQVCAVTTLNKLNYPELPKLAGLLDLIEIDSWQLQLAMPAGRMKKQSNFLIDEKDFEKICGMIISLREQYPKLNIQAADCFGLAPENLIRTSRWTGCQAGISAMAIDACGYVMPCLSLQGIQGENVKDMPISEIWETSKCFDLNRRFETETVKGLCRDCEHLTKCRGGCNSQSFSYYGSFHDSPFCFYRTYQTNK